MSEHDELLNVFGKARQKVLAVCVEGIGLLGVFVGRVDDWGVDPALRASLGVLWRINFCSFTCFFIIACTPSCLESPTCQRREPSRDPSSCPLRARRKR